MVPPSEACLYDHINWSVAQAQQKSSMGFHFNVQKRPVTEFSGASLAKRPYLERKIEACPGGRKSPGGSVSASFSDARKKGSNGGCNT